MPMNYREGGTFTCDLRGKTALVTGASSGIGAHLAQTLAAAGARVAVSARRVERLSAPSRGCAVALDVTERTSIDAAFDRAEAELGAIDVLINNAGITLTKPALEIDLAEWDVVLATNLRGPFLVAQSFARRLIARKLPGSIVNVGSILSERVAGSLSAYAASKAGLVQLTRALALEWARYDIRVNAVEPGYIETAMTADFFTGAAGAAMIKRIPQRRLGRSEDLDGPVLLLASDASAYVTGAVLAVDGGHLVSTL